MSMSNTNSAGAAVAADKQGHGDNTAPRQPAAELLEILVCPVDHGKLELATTRLSCQVCGRKYPIVDGIPVMLVDEAKME